MKGVSSAGFDPILLLTPILLLSFGILVIFSTSPTLARQQLIFAILGLFIYLFFAFFDYHFWKKLAIPLYLVSCLLLLVTIFGGRITRGAVRWFEIGAFHFQPSEVAKLVLILTLGFYLASKMGQSLSLKTLFNSLLLTLIPLILVFCQPAVGSSLLLGAVWLGVIVVAGVRPFYLVSLSLISGVLLPLVWFFLKDYQRSRFLAFLNPQVDPLGTGYNVIQSMIAVGSGRFFGRGLGRGPQSQLKFLPERHTDFAFACLAEEWGLFGSLILLTLFFLLLWRILKIGGTAKDYFGVLLCGGVATLMLAQIGVNIGMNLGLLPITGIPLPLISYGGSSLVTTLALLGLVQSVATRREK